MGPSGSQVAVSELRREVLALTPEEARRLLDAARGDRLEALYSVALALGLRQGEALGLMWSDLEVGTLRVRRRRHARSCRCAHSHFVSGA
ncbi:MAG TPA: hypothetical protein DEV93_14875 [Chloroflexi bacterium]|nr:hypothetical protein [Chloroflexota bacterium]